MITINKKDVVFKKQAIFDQTLVSFFKHTRHKGAVIVDDDEILIGVVSRGDFLRRDDIKSESCINLRPKVFRLGSNISDHNKDINFYPVVNDDNKLIKVVEKFDNFDILKLFNIDGVMVVAEIGNNHNGNYNSAIELIELASASGANAVKFQLRVLGETYINTSEDYLRETDFGTSYTVRQLKKFNLNYSEVFKLMRYARDIGLVAFCTPFDVTSLQRLISSEEKVIKIASADLMNFEFQAVLKEYNGHLLMSTGMHHSEDIDKVANWAQRNFVNVTFLQTNSTYPTPYEDVNLSYLTELKEKSTTGLVGYSGHERGYHVALASMCFGATIIEKHFTTDKSLPGNDHKVSLLPKEMASLTSQSKNLQLSIGQKTRGVSQGEVLNRISLSKSIYTSSNFVAGTKITETDIVLRSPCIGMTASEFSAYRGLVLSKDKKAGDPLYKSDFKEVDETIDYHNLAAFGLPVRMRDVKEIWEEFKPKFVEYHLFSTDLEIDPINFNDRLIGRKFKIHAPEQFDDGFIIDFVNINKSVRTETWKRFEKVFQWADRLKQVIGYHGCLDLVANVGGATKNLEEKLLTKPQMYELISQLVEHGLSRGINILPQTMPPEPWHFGGQGYHNLFVSLNDMLEIQSYHKMNFCLDTSHSWLSCHKLGEDFWKQLERVKHVTSYAHISDALSPNGEGLQLGEGEIDTKKLMEHIIHNNIEYIPEIWNGHMENFKGFRTALSKLSRIKVGK
jgi:sialic acid synthase SpsE/sugar phosphate isomerase/epimerase